MLFLSDTSSLLDAKDGFYSFEFVPYFWDWLELKGREGQFKVCQEAYDELKVDNGTFGAWIRQPTVRDAILLDEELDSTNVDSVLHAYGWPNLTEQEFEICANDAGILSYCLTDITRRTIVTAEVSKPTATGHRRKMPDVAKDLDIRAVTLITALRELSFSVP